MWLYCTSVHANDIKCVSLLNLPLITAGGGKGWSLNALWGKLSCWWAAGAGTEWGRWSLGGFQLMTAQKVWKAAMSFWFSSDENVESWGGCWWCWGYILPCWTNDGTKGLKSQSTQQPSRWVSKQHSNSYYTPCIGVYWKTLCYQTRRWHVTHIFYPFKYRRA